MKKSILLELIGENDAGYCYAELELPSSNEEISSAKEKANWNSSTNSFRDIDIDECPLLPKITSVRLDCPTIEELNFFAERLNMLSDEEIILMQGVFEAKFGNMPFDDDLVSVTDLINMTYGLDSVMIASNVGNLKQLGQFVVENGLNEDINAMPEASLYLLDMEKVGKLQQKIDEGVFIGNHYVVAGSFEMPHVYDGQHLPERNSSPIENDPIKRVTAQDIKNISCTDGLVLQGCGGDLKEWLDGINVLLTDAGILRNGSRFEEAYAFHHDGLTNMLFPFNEDMDIDYGRFAMWRLSTHEQFGGTWLSDYINNRLDADIEEPMYESQEMIQ